MLGICGVLLAGGQARRIGGGDKCLLKIGERTLLHHVIARALPQVEDLILNTNSEPGRFSAFGLPVVADTFEGYLGPLAGILAGMRWAESQPGITHVASFAGDTPFFPKDLVARLIAVRRANGAEIVLASSRGRTHPVFGL